MTLRDHVGLNRPRLAGEAANVPVEAIAFLDDVRGLADERRRDVVSVLVFGSLAIGGFSRSVSDVDLTVVLADEAPPDAARTIARTLAELEQRHGLRERRQSPLAPMRRAGDLRIGGFKPPTVCRRADLLSGDVASVFGVRPGLASLSAPTLRFCLAAIRVSSEVVWGEDLRDRILVPPISRRCLARNFRLHLLRNACALLGYPLLPNATKYSMTILKGFLHDCYFVYTSRLASTDEEVAFLRTKLGNTEALDRLVSLRREYRPSPGFVLRCFGALARVYAVTVRENAFPVSPASPQRTHGARTPSTLATSGNPHEQGRHTDRVPTDSISMNAEP